MKVVRTILGIVLIVASIIPGGFAYEQGYHVIRTLGFDLFNNGSIILFGVYKLHGWQIYLPSLVLGAVAILMVFTGIHFLRSTSTDT